MYNIDTDNFDKEVYRLMDAYKRSFDANVALNEEQLLGAIGCQLRQALHNAMLKWASWHHDDVVEYNADSPEYSLEDFRIDQIYHR